MEEGREKGMDGGREEKGKEGKRAGVREREKREREKESEREREREISKCVHGTRIKMCV